MKTETIKINQTTEAVLISSKMEGTMALIDLNTLKRITALMSKSKFTDIRDHFMIGLHSTENIEQYVAMMKEEINFHECCNLITTIETPEHIQESKH